MVQTSKFSDMSYEDDILVTPADVQAISAPSATPVTGGVDDNDDSNNVNLTTEEEQELRLKKASGIAGAILGLLLGGPILAAIAGFGAAYAVRKQNAVGEKARQLGQVALTVREKAREVDETHALSETTKKVVGDVWTTVETVDPTRLAKKTQQLAVQSWTDMVNYTQEHRLIERGVEGTGQGFEYLSTLFTREETPPAGYEHMPTATTE
jgi:hypothetical protein